MPSAVLEEVAAEHLAAFELGDTSTGRLLFEVGRICARVGLPREHGAAGRAAALWAAWEERARSAVRCWLWVGRRLGLPPAAVQRVAAAAWAGRAAWSAGPAAVRCGCGAAAEAERQRAAKELVVRGAVLARRAQAEAVRLLREELQACARCREDEREDKEQAGRGERERAETRVRELEEQLAAARAASEQLRAFAKQQHQPPPSAERWPLLFRVMLALLLLRAFVAPMVEL